LKAQEALLGENIDNSNPDCSEGLSKKKRHDLQNSQAVESSDYSSVAEGDLDDTEFDLTQAAKSILDNLAFDVGSIEQPDDVISTKASKKKKKKAAESCE